MAKYISVTQGATVAASAWKIVQGELNAILMANPVGLVVGTVAALAGGIYLLNQHNEKLTEEWNRQLDLDISNEYNKQRSAVDQLAESYKTLGNNARESMVASAEQKFFQANQRLQEALANKQMAEQAVIDATNAGFFGTAFNADFDRAMEELDRVNRELTLAQAGRSAQTDNIQRLVQGGALSPVDAMKIFGGQQLGLQLQQKAPEQQAPKPSFTPAQQQVINQMNQTIGGNMKLQLEVKNNSDLPVALSQGSGRTFDVQPKTKSTTELDEK